MNKCIWYLSKYAVTPLEGDPASRPFGLMREFARMGLLPVIVTASSQNDKEAIRHFRRSRIFTQEGVTVVVLNTLKYASSKSFRRILSWVHFEAAVALMPRKNLPRPDVIIVSSLSLFTIFNGIRLRRIYGSRLIFEIRDIWPLTLTEEGGFSSRHPAIRILAAIERHGYKRADAIVGTMPNLGEHVAQVMGREMKTFCIPMGVDIEWYGETETSNPLFKQLKEEFVVGYAGSLGTSNAMNVLFQCAELLRTNAQIHFRILGDGQLRSEYITKYGDLPNITFLDPVPKHFVRSFLEECDVLFFAVHNSKVWDYGLSLNKLIDYMASGKPIVASYSGFQTMINEAESGSFVSAEDPGALLDEIIKFQRMPKSERVTVGERGKSWLFHYRSYRRLALQYFDILFPIKDYA